MPDSAGLIYLVGPMGSGKTTIGQRLAKELGLDFLDCDHELEAQTGASIQLIFDVEGERGFRERESKLLRKLSSRRNAVLATGGGVVLRAENRDLLRRGGLVIFLRATVAQQLQRLSRDKTRPLLQAPDRKARLARLAEERNPLYEAVADIEFPSRSRNPDTAAHLLAERVRAFLEESPGDGDPGMKRTPA